MSIKAIIFDVDGTLAETEETHRRAYNLTFTEFGLDWTWSQEFYGELLHTFGGRERLAAYMRDHLNQTPDPELIARIHKSKTETYGRLVNNGAIKLRPGIARLVADAKETGVRLAVASATGLANIERLTEACFGRPVGDVFEVVAAGDDVANKKPAPDIFLLALARLGLSGSDCVGLEDSRSGLLSCIGAGMACVVSPGFYPLGSDFNGAAGTVSSFEEIDTVAKLKAVLGR